MNFWRPGIIICINISFNTLVDYRVARNLEDVCFLLFPSIFMCCFFSICNKPLSIVYFKYIHWGSLFFLRHFQLWQSSCFYLESLLSFLRPHKINPFSFLLTTCTYLVALYMSYIFSINLTYSVFLPVVFVTWLGPSCFMEAFSFRKV